MLDLKKQLLPIRKEVDIAIAESLDRSDFIQGSAVQNFEKDLQTFLGSNHVITCGNGTDAIQIALMALDLVPGDEVVVPAFTYISALEVLSLLQLTPVFVDVEGSSFNIDPSLLEKSLTKRTRAIIVVHLYGQMADMKTIMTIAKARGLSVIEDNAQSFGAKETESGRQSGTIGHIGCTSFFPTKILGGMGDGGAISTNDPNLAQRMRMIAKHGQSKKYHHMRVGINSRLDTIQAAILKVKLNYVEEYIQKRIIAAEFYDRHLALLKENIEIPHRVEHSDHVFHQYTIKVKKGKRDLLKEYLQEHEIPTAIYYPLATNKQEAYRLKYNSVETPVSNALAMQVLSLPMHTELTSIQLNYICQTIISFYK